ncbi:MAG: hypothetical protein QHH02_00940 [Syntrophomonadaceae bacterium]|nr:hypothetical protein [Syntrophomonadaceae bacterium]
MELYMVNRKEKLLLELLRRYRQDYQMLCQWLEESCRQRAEEAYLELLAHPDDPVSNEERFELINGYLAQAERLAAMREEWK